MTHYTAVQPKYKSSLVCCGNFETTEGLRASSPAANVNAHTTECNWCAEGHISIRSCDFTNGYFQGRETDRHLLYRTPAGCVPEEGSREEQFRLHVLQSTAPKIWDEDFGFA